MRNMRNMKTVIHALLLALLLAADAGASGMALLKPSKLNSDLSNPKLDALNCRTRWIDVQKTNATAFDWQILDQCLATAAANGKTVVAELDFAPADVGSGGTGVPAWAEALGVPTVSIAGVTNKFPVWWNPTYKLYAKAAISAFTARYNTNSQVVGYVVTGASGVLSTSLAGEQTNSLCTAFQAKGYDGQCPADVKAEDAVGTVFEAAFLEIGNHWLASTSKPLVFVSRLPVDPLALSGVIDAQLLAGNPQIVVVGSGFAACDLITETLTYYQLLQSQGHNVGWWSIAPHGFPETSGGQLQPGVLAAGITCAGTILDPTKLWFGFSGNTWVQNPDAADAAYDLFH